jgi:DNA-directed RNA polymerase specialized sigma24 family protein
LKDFVPDPSTPLEERFMQEYEFDENYKSLLARLTPLEREVAEEYCKDGSYREISVRRNLGIKTVDNSIMRIKKKGQETFADWLKASEFDTTRESDENSARPR